MIGVWTGWIPGYVALGMLLFVAGVIGYEVGSRRRR